MTGLRKERTSGIVQSPLYMNLVVTARTGISARESRAATGDLHIAQLSGVVFSETDPAGTGGDPDTVRCRRIRETPPPTPHTHPANLNPRRLVIFAGM